MAIIKSRKPRFKLSIYFICHARACVFSLGKMWRTPFATIMSIAVIAIALALPATLSALLHNVEGVGQTWSKSSTRISIYLRRNISTVRTQDLIHQLRTNPQIANVEYISPDQGLQQLATALSNNAVKLLRNNPLPGVIIVEPVLSLRLSSSISQLVDNLSNLPEASLVQLDMQWLQRLQNIVNVINNAIFALAFLLGLGVVLIVGNTIRLVTQNERSQIAVFKLVGATNAFIRRPFLYAGIWYGIFSAFGAWGVVNLFLYWLQGPVAQLAASYNSDFYLNGLSGSNIMMLFIFSIILAFLGSWIAVARSLRVHQ